MKTNLQINLLKDDRSTHSIKTFVVYCKFCLVTLLYSIKISILNENTKWFTPFIEKLNKSPIRYFFGLSFTNIFSAFNSAVERLNNLIFGVFPSLFYYI